MVKTWNSEEGWGTVALDHVELTVWVHYSHIAAEGHRSLAPGQQVQCHHEVPGQDGYPARAVEVSARQAGRYSSVLVRSKVTLEHDLLD
ncbi:cold-shock protein [Micromonospora sp. RTGN7]|uniref:cold-shock protein n=1 Tax=Micromonospora sp. RTGN7 TaxID=3016526 RepID=UPI0029FF104C|nr:cold shock domain-containing protein [Micromonospora sp. RTGN7]